MNIDSAWPEIQLVKIESRHELTLSGDKIASKISDNSGLIDESLYEIGKQLNYLKLSKLGLLNISPKLSNLKQLTQLSIVENKITVIPHEISLLSNLVYFDLSFNNIISVPEIFNNMSKLRTLNLRNNQISEIVSLNGLSSLQELFLDHNKLTTLPNDMFNLVQIMVLNLSHNEISEIPPNIVSLKNMKTLNLESNNINNILPELGQMTRIKQLQLKNNPLKNAKTQLKKLINDNLYKAISEYLKKLETETPKRARNRNSSSKKSESSTAIDGEKYIKITNEDLSRKIIIKNRSSISRSQVVYFIVHNLQFDGEKLKKFVKLQEHLHKNDCENRKLITIGVHDLAEVKFPLTYSPKQSDGFKIQMLNHSKIETGKALFERLLVEADSERKTKKRGQLSGVHQYLHMIDINDLQGVVEDIDGTILSYPPLTNCNSTKITVETTDLLVEVIGLKLEKCKIISENIIKWLLENEISSFDSHLEIEPVRVFEDNSEISFDSGQNLLVLFPSRTDLLTLGVSINRQ